MATMIEDPAMMLAFLKLGASGYVTKSSYTAVLVAAIRAAGGLGGASWVPLTEDMLTLEDFGEDGADRHAWPVRYEPRSRSTPRTVDGEKFVEPP